MKRDEALELIAVTKDDGISVTTMRSVGKWLELGQSNERHIDCVSRADSFLECKGELMDGEEEVRRSNFAPN